MSQRPLIALVVALSLTAHGKPGQPEREQPAKPLDDILSRADAVLADGARDPVNAAKKADAVFSAANALVTAGKLEKADEYFVGALQLSPWALGEQLNRARLLKRLKRDKEAKEIATMVWSRAETDKLCDEAGSFLGKPVVSRPPLPPATGVKGPWICFVNIGPVEWQPVGDLMKRLHDTLGIPVYCADSGLGIGAHDRSALNRWVQKEIVPSIRWDTEQGTALFKSFGVPTKEEIPPEKLIATMLAGLREIGRTDDADGLELNAGWFRMWDRQWNVSVLLNQLNSAWRSDVGSLNSLANVPGRDKAIVIGITASDIYEGDVNYLFGSAFTNGGMGVTSYARFQAAMWHEPPDRRRLVARIYRQCLSSIGFAIGVPRPTDPTSARAYPGSVPEQDAKSEYMSEACIAGFERALDVTLPKAAHKPKDAR